MLTFIQERQVFEFRALYVGDGSIRNGYVYLSLDLDISTGDYLIKGSGIFYDENTPLSHGIVSLPFTKEEAQLVIQQWINEHPEEGMAAGTGIGR